jgi:GDP-4-dehydro-6-deoxy-D-mannose reductase
MTKILVTGASGFVSRHLLEYLESLGSHAEVLGVSRTAPPFSTAHFKHVHCTFRELDLLDKEVVDAMMYGFQPDYIVHLAAYSSVGYSWHKPVESFANNTNIFLNLLEQVRALDLRCRVLSVGSSEEYGDVDPASLPLREDTRLRPVSPYAVARVSQEMLSTVYARGYGLDIVMTRSFNHTGPFQREVFAVPSLAKQLVAISKGEAPARLVTGDRTIVRDFVDVRDVVRAYHSLLMKGERGEVYNVCTGEGTSIGRVVEMMQEMLGTDAVVETDPRLLRPSDNRAVIGSNDKIKHAIGWVPEIALRESLRGVLDWWAGH